MSVRSDPKPPRKPVLPEQPYDDRRRPNRPVEPAGDTELPVEVPPEEAERRDPDPRSRDTL